MPKKQLISIILFSVFFTFICLQGAHLFASPKSKKPARAAFFVAHTKQAIFSAEHETSKLNAAVLHLEGISSPKVRYLLNNLCSLPETRYLEIGSWKGATLCAALYKNESSVKDAVAIENWSQLGEGREEFFRNVETFIKRVPLRFFEEDCFSIEKREIFQQPVNIFFYSGNHREPSLEKAFAFYDSVFDDIFIAVVDDWNWEEVRVGTKNAFQQLHYEILFEKELFTGFSADTDSWWNGLYVAVIKKKQNSLRSPSSHKNTF